MYRAKIMIYVKVVLKIRYDPRVKRLSESQKSFKFPPFFCGILKKKCGKIQSMQKNMVKKKKIEIVGLFSCERENLEQKNSK